MIYASDLDRTLIFSKGFLKLTDKATKCVDAKDDAPISYMTIEAIEKLENIIKDNDTYFIPVTTRSLEQYRRVIPVQNSKYSIVANGGIILKNGKPWDTWNNIIKKDKIKYKTDYNEPVDLLKPYKRFFNKEEIRFVDNVFVYVYLSCSNEDIQEVVNHVEKNIDLTKWHWTLQGKKLYIIPIYISKERALSYLKEYIERENKSKEYMITSGDGKLDLEFLKLGDEIIIPEKSEVLYYDSNLKYKSVGYGLEGTIEMLNYISQKNKEACD